MIHAHIAQRDGMITGFEISGHADSGAYGQDIVCAAVSVLAINTLNSLEKLLQMKLDLVSNEAEGGYLKLTLAKKDQQDPKAQLLLESFKLGLTDVAQSYQEYITVDK